MKCRRYWFQFEFKDFSDLPPGMAIGCGITAWNYEDAINILNDVFDKYGIKPAVKAVIEDVNISELDAGLVLPNMRPPNERGIWFPLL
jgi:hypothetical protein